jgi:hypothetical protein
MRPSACCIKAITVIKLCKITTKSEDLVVYHKVAGLHPPVIYSGF